MKPNIVFVLADQLRAASLPLYGGDWIETPNIDRLAREGVTLTECVSTCPVCTPYRSMLLTGRHPQTTGMTINSLRPRYEEISVGDVLSRHGYRTAWIGKWHLHTGAWPANNVPDWVPRGRPRLGFGHWRGYNQHMVYFNGFINSPYRDFDVIHWNGYETEGLLDFALEFMNGVDSDAPFALFLSPQQPHIGRGKPESPTQMAPERFYERLPDEIRYPENVPESIKNEDPGDRTSVPSGWRNYHAMILALDEMLGKLLDYLEESGEAEDTLIVFTSDHGTQGGAHGIPFWDKKVPYVESMNVPCILRLPGTLDGGRRCNALTAPVDFFPSLCSLCGPDTPPTVEGVDLSRAWRGDPTAPQQDALFCMNFGSETDYFTDGEEWRGVRTLRWQYTEWLDGTRELYDHEDDPLEMKNRVDDPECAGVVADMQARLRKFQEERGDRMLPGSAYEEWVDEHRRVIRNGFGPLGHPETPPDWPKWQNVNRNRIYSSKKDV